MNKKILIANAVPTNNGDAALVFGLYEKLKKLGYDVLISTVKYDTITKIYPDKNWIKSEYDFTKLQKGIFKLVPSLRKKVLESKIKNNPIYKDIDFIISAPGGYINSYYGFEDKFYCMELMKELHGCKLIMYSQSVGPLNDYDKDVLDRYINSFELFMVRDQVSYDNVKQYNNIIKTNDAAFLLEYETDHKEKENKIAISVREWKHDGRDKERYINLMKSIAKMCVDSGHKVEFVSTCQGLSNYVNDSVIANQIKDELEEKYKENVEVNDNFYTLNELREYIRQFKFVIGTRLHMCILSVMAGVPAFNISYEVKGKECYNILNLSDYSIDYNGNIDESLEKIQYFIDNNKELETVYRDKAKEMNEEANKYFDYVIENIVSK
ncbi:MAG: polysaccharide pyruvyl transferase family protein [Peptostreptococcaceae bacterium]